MGDSASSTRVSVHNSLGGGSGESFSLYHSNRLSDYHQSLIEILRVCLSIQLLIFEILRLELADLLLWRNPTGAVIVLVSSTVFWFLFERAGYNLLSFVSNVLLLLVAILFLWAKSASLLNRPLPPMSLVLWAISYVGTLINSLTLVYIGILLSLSVPLVYEKYQDHIDDKLNSTSKVIRSISMKIPMMPVSKEKKYQ
ncbi:hypothetical protein IGI04_020068 [Brassica rapa subsp. trilocularis]|uniref:Reticulon-like protein n=1 Tax=Brassica rapa subsp. trilocularis TaxID=1813537 RepID=A0ABQ7MHP8_BRACM|nr:hypothetical protein IGI04_020068 [Brassica rapa subsp. trilocularis]